MLVLNLRKKLMEFKIKIFNNLNNELQKIWNDLENCSDLYVFQTLDWFKNWHKTYLDKDNDLVLKVVVVENDSKNIAIFPFCIEKKLGLNILRWAGDKEFDYCSPILNNKYKFNKDSFKTILNLTFSELKNIDIIKLTKQPKFLNEYQNPFVNFLNNYFDSKNYFISLPNNWNFFEKNILKKDFRSQNKRKKNNLKKHGTLKFKVINDQKEINSLLVELFEQKNIRLSSKKSGNLFAKKDLMFYKDLFRNQNKSFKMHLSYLKLNNETLAMHLGTIYNKRYYYLVLSMGQKLEKYSPGRLLISLLIRWSIAKKLKYFDFTLGDESYKKNWTDSSSSYYNCIESKSLYGSMLISFFKLKYLIKHYDRSRIFINFLKKIKINF